MLSETISNQCDVEKCAEGRRTFFIKATWRLFRYEVNACLLKVFATFSARHCDLFWRENMLMSKKVLLFV